MRKNSSSSEAVRGTSAAMPIPASPSAIDSAVPLVAGGDREAAVGEADVGHAVAPGGDRGGADVVGGAQRVAAGGRGEQLLQRALVDDAPGADDRHAVAELLDLAHQVRDSSTVMP